MGLLDTNEQKKTIILVRHGESDFNKKGIIQGQTNLSKLTERGVNQAESVASWLQGLAIKQIYTSPLARAKKTAGIISKATNSALKVDDNLIEIDFGTWVNKDRKLIVQSFPELYKLWRKRPYDLQIDGEYPVRNLYSRIKDFKDITFPVQEKNTDISVVVAHRGSISALLVTLLKLPKSHHHFLQLDRGSVTVLQERTAGEGDYELYCANERPMASNSEPVDFHTEERTQSSGELFIVRHGQTKSNIDRRYQGGKDIELSSLGKKTIRELSKTFSPKLPTRIISSPLKRAKESATIIADSFHIKSIGERKDLHEFLYGVWEGMTEGDVKKNRTQEYNQWNKEPIDFKIPHGEHINDAYNRCSVIWEYYENDINTWGGSIISVAHDVVNRLLICNALDLPSKYLWRFKQTNASISVLAIKPTMDGRLRILNHSPYNLHQRLEDEWL